MRRFIPRFSLRTLMLFALLVGSGATLWWNWGPWVVERTLHTEGRVHSAKFTADDSRIVVNSVVEPSHLTGIELYSFQTGAHVRSLRVPAKNGSPANLGSQISKNFVWIAANTITSALFDLDTGKTVIPPEGCEPLNPDVYLYNDWVGFRQKNGLNVKFFHVPELSPAPEYFRDGYPSNSGIFVLNRWTVKRIDTGEFVMAIPESHTWVNWMPGDWLRFDAMYPGPRGVQAWNARTGKRIFENAARVEFHPATGRAILWDAAGNVSLAHGEAGPRIPLANGATSACFSPSGAQAFLSPPLQAFDAQTGARLWISPLLTLTQDFSTHEAMLGAQTPDGLVEFLDSRTGRAIFRIRSDGFIQRYPHEIDIPFTSTAERFLTMPPGETTTGMARSNTVQVWHRNRPIAWYGPAYLPEFWLTVVLAAAFLWSVYRDRSALRGKPKEARA